MKPKTWTLPKFTVTAEAFVQLQVAHDPKEHFCGVLERLWFTVGTFDLENDGSGKVPAHYFHDRPELQALLLEFGWLVENNGELFIKDWAEHKPGHLREAERKRRSRRAASWTCPGQSGDNPRVAGDNPQAADHSDSDSVSDSVSDKEQEPPKSPKGESARILWGTWEELVRIWNEKVAQCNGTLSRVRKMTDSRRKKANARLQDAGFFELFQEALEHLPINNWKDSDWQPDFDWLVANDSNAMKVAEGKYDRNDPNNVFKELDC